MKAFKTLLKREWLEARLPFLWLPLGAFGFFVTVSLLGLLISGTGEFELLMNSEGDSPNFLLIDQWSESDWAVRTAAFRSLATAPFYVIYVFGALFTLLGALYDERKDRSVLFWKSMPVNDYQTVASKLALVTLIAPLIMLGVALLNQIYLLILATGIVWSLDLGEASSLWWHSGLIGGTGQMLLGFAIQFLWWLPISGYLLFVSATVPRLTLLWALLVPAVAMLGEFMLFRTRVISTGIAKHMEPAALPDFIADDDRIMPIVSTVGEQLSLLVNVDLWIGVAIGLAFLYGAVWMRGYRNEL